MTEIALPASAGRRPHDFETRHDVLECLGGLVQDAALAAVLRDLLEPHEADWLSCAEALRLLRNAAARSQGAPRLPWRAAGAHKFSQQYSCMNLLI